MMLGEGLLEEDDTRRLAYIAAEIEMVGHDSAPLASPDTSRGSFNNGYLSLFLKKTIYSVIL